MFTATRSDYNLPYTHISMTMTENIEKVFYARLFYEPVNEWTVCAMELMCVLELFCDVSENDAVEEKLIRNSSN